jgi:hypothetical protein
MPSGKERRRQKSGRIALTGAYGSGRHVSCTFSTSIRSRLQTDSSGGMCRDPRGIRVEFELCLHAHLV